MNVLQEHGGVHSAGQGLDEGAVILLSVIAPIGAVEAAQDEGHGAGAKGGGDAEGSRDAGEVQVVRLGDRHAHEGPVAGACHWILPL